MGLPLLAVGLAGAAVSAFGSYESGQATAAAEAYQAQVAANNAIIAKQNARLDIQSGETQATNEELKTRAQVGTEKAGQGAGGIDVNTGSAADVRAGTSQIGYLDALTIRSNSAKQAYGQLVQGATDTAESQLLTMESGSAAEAGDIGAIGGLLTGASTVGGRYAAYQAGNPSGTFSIPGFVGG